MATTSRTRERTIARRIAFDEIDLERERQSQQYDYDDDVSVGKPRLLDIANDYIIRAAGLNGSRRDIVKAGAMIVAALEVDTDEEMLG